MTSVRTFAIFASPERPVRAYHHAMQLDRMRVKVLMAMGLSLGGCSKEKTDVKSPPDDATSTATATATPTAAPTTSTAETPTTTTTAPLATTGIGGRVGLPTGGGGCGWMPICKPPPGGAGARAAKPFEACAASIPAGTDPESKLAHAEASFDVDLTNNRKTTAPICCYKAPRTLCGGGRPLRSAEGPILAPAAQRTDWRDEALLATPAAHDRRLAEAWLRDAAFEHASVASFARASLQLLGLGAPADLVRAVHDAACDEIEHARIGYALATRRGAKSAGPGPLAIDRAPFATTLEAFVRDTFLDGCVAETTAALEVRERAAAPDYDAVERSALLRIADDEDRHVALAWRMLAWAVETGGAPARAALEEALEATAAPDADMVVETIIIPCTRALLST